MEEKTEEKLDWHPVTIEVIETMSILDEGHTYKLKNVDQSELEFQTISFIKKQPSSSLDGTNDMETVSDGTTTEAVLQVLIDRMRFLQKQFPCTENDVVTMKLIEALMWLNRRTQDRLTRGVEGKNIA